MCAYTDGHTFCRYPPGPSPQCVGYIDARLSQDDKSRVLRRLNRRRSEVARGGRGLPAAADMLKLRWVEELSREAQRWADQCQPPSTVEHQDDCRDLYSITVGQCISSVVGEAPGLRFESMVDMWPMQARLYKRFLANVTQTVDKSRGYYGDYAQMFWSRTYMVGCGRSRFMIPWHGRERSVDRLVCNFAPRWPGTHRELWAPGEPASACPARSRPDLLSPDLCSYPETDRQLQEAIDLMERKLAASAPVSTSGKVRRELRDLKHKFKNESTQNALPETVNDTDRGPMINMVLKYIPYLKPFEKSIIGDSKANVNNAKVVSPCFILFIVLYF
ncbi:venom allergen 5-like [Bicyclus anynana]|uniref:Venom allergen 5-like n=1 Tax=Bicyclus anynana TaxID=110368 RepID=A0ABM3LNW5_BICAN|nr:venom allergen 5-like [Bicyclus anynana]